MQQLRFNDNYSKGCQSCQEGKWLCIFLTYLCNAKCVFCPAPFKQEDKIVSAFGDDPAFILESIKDKPFNGISFSGGDPFLVFDRLIEWLSYFKKHRQDIYYWVYTSGLAVNRIKLEQLARAGLDEIRFNIAAADYNSSAVLEAIEIAGRVIKNVVVEVPSIPTDYEKLMKVLPYLVNLGVKYLNLHEYILVPNDPQSKTTKSAVFIMNKEKRLKYDIFSLENTEKIKQFCRENTLDIKVNSCSLYKKENQMLHRRLRMGSMLKQEHEHLSQNGMLETYFIYPDKLTAGELQKFIFTERNFGYLKKYFLHPKAYNKQDIKGSIGTIAKLSFLPPLSIDGKRVLIQTYIVNNTETKGENCNE